METQVIFKLSALEEDILTILRSQELRSQELRSQDDMYGLQIIKYLEKAHEGQKRIKEGSIYPTLHRMEIKGFVESYWGEDRPEDRGGARRKYYQLTGDGRQVLNSRHAVRERLSSSFLQPCPA